MAFQQQQAQSLQRLRRVVQCFRCEMMLRVQAFFLGATTVAILHQVAYDTAFRDQATSFSSFNRFIGEPSGGTAIVPVAKNSLHTDSECSTAGGGDCRIARLQR